MDLRNFIFTLAIVIYIFIVVYCYFKNQEQNDLIYSFNEFDLDQLSVSSLSNDFEKVSSEIRHYTIQQKESNNETDKLLKATKELLQKQSKTLDILMKELTKQEIVAMDITEVLSSSDDQKDLKASKDEKDSSKDSHAEKKSKNSKAQKKSKESLDSSEIEDLNG